MSVCPFLYPLLPLSAVVSGGILVVTALFRRLRRLHPSQCLLRPAAQNSYHWAPPSNVAEGGHARRDQRTPAGGLALFLHTPAAGPLPPSLLLLPPLLSSIGFSYCLAGGAEFLA